MAKLTVLAFLLFAGAAVADAGSTSKDQSVVSPVQKVIQMLTDMQAAGRQAKMDEEVAYSKFKTWCETEAAHLNNEIAKNKEEIELLDTAIMKLESDIKALGEAIAGLQSDVADDTASQQQATNKRGQEHNSFLAVEQDFSESVNALDRAISTLQSENYDRPAAAAVLLQLSGPDSRVPGQAKSIISAFITMMGADKTLDPDLLDYAAPEANAYEFQSGHIVELLKKLKDDFRSKLGTAQKEEKNSLHAYNMIMTDLKDSIENAERGISEKTIEKESKIQQAALSKQQLASTTELKAQNEKTLASLTTECMEKGLSYEEKQNLRIEELQAIAKAIEILSSPEVSGSSDKYLDLAQTKPAKVALVQSSGETLKPIRRRIRDFLASEGQRLRSKNLELLADKVAEDPFAKVKQLIDSMITRLLEEANADADHEGFCTKEMGMSKITRTRLSEEIEGLNAAVENGKAVIMALQESTSTLTKEVEELIASMGEATDMRKAEKAKNAEIVKDAQAAQQAVAAAIAILKTHYEKAMTATGFLQVQGTPAPRKWGLKMGIKMGTEEWNQLANPNYEGTVTAGEANGMDKVDTGHKEGMQTFGETEYGQQQEAEYGVLALLDVIQSDFAKLEADTVASETASQRSYDDFMIESRRSKATRDRKIEMNNSDQAAAESKLSTDIADLKATQDELLAADRYHSKLVPQCIDSGMTFDDRIKSRQEEIASLKQALSILSSKDIVTSSF